MAKAPSDVDRREGGGVTAISDIDTADHVRHAPSNEDWFVAYVRGDRLAWCGWPEGEASLADCTLLKKATPEERDELLRVMASGTESDLRTTYARHRLGQTT